MRNLILSFSLTCLLALPAPCAALEYGGRNIEGIKIPARAFYRGTGGVFDVMVVFEGRRATLYFNDGTSTTIRIFGNTLGDNGEIQGYGGLGTIYLNPFISIGARYSELHNRFEDFWNLSIDTSVLK